MTRFKPKPEPAEPEPIGSGAGSASSCTEPQVQVQVQHKTARTHTELDHGQSSQRPKPCHKLKVVQLSLCYSKSCQIRPHPNHSHRLIHLGFNLHLLASSSFIDFP